MHELSYKLYHAKVKTKYGKEEGEEGETNKPQKKQKN